jgi:hypothetical protein
MSGLVSILTAAALLAQPPLALDVKRDRDALRVSFQLIEELPEAIDAALPTGALVRVRYPLRVRIPRRLWWDRKIWKGEVTASATFDPVTGRYRCAVVLDGVIVTSRELETAASARQFLTNPGPVLLSLPPTKKSPLKVRVRAIFSSSTKWLLFPAAEGTKWVEVPISNPKSDGAGTVESGEPTG